MKIGSWCSGVGGLDRAVEELTGGEVVWQSETDPAASRVLAHHWPGVPNLGDLKAVEWASVEPVDVVCAGFPCQPVSSEGRRKALADERWLWDDIARALGDLGTRPRWVFLENVRGLLTAGGGLAFGRVVHDLAHFGYVGRYRLLPASAVGAPHQRERVFVLACLADSGGPPGGQPGDAFAGTGSQAPGDPAQPGRCSRPPADAGSHFLRPEPECVGGGGGSLGAGAPGQAAADAGCVRVGLRRDAGSGEGSHACGQVDPAGGCRGFGAFQPAIDRWGAVLGRPAPAGLDGRRVNPRFVEWMMGFPEGWVTDLVGRRDALRCLGNAVVSLQALAAYRSLL